MPQFTKQDLQEAFNLKTAVEYYSHLSAYSEIDANYN